MTQPRRNALFIFADQMHAFAMGCWAIPISSLTQRIREHYADIMLRANPKANGYGAKTDETKPPHGVRTIIAY